MVSASFLSLSLTDVSTGTLCKTFTSLQADTILLGRGARANEECHLPTSGLFRSDQTKCMSQKHAELSWDKGQYAFLKDVGSTNGTFVEREGAEAWKLKAGIPYRLKNGDKVTFGKVMNSPDGNTVYTPISLLVKLAMMAPPLPRFGPAVDLATSFSLSTPLPSSLASPTPRPAYLPNLRSTFELSPSPESPKLSPSPECPSRKGYGLSEAELLQSPRSDAGSVAQFDSDEEVEKLEDINEATYSGAKGWSLVDWTPQEWDRAETQSLAHDHEIALFEDDEEDRTQVVRSASPLLELVYSPAHDEPDVEEDSDLEAASSQAVEIESEPSQLGSPPRHQPPISIEGFGPGLEAEGDDDDSSESSQPLHASQQPLPSSQPSARRSSIDELLPSFSQRIKELRETQDDDDDEESCASHLPSPEESPPRMVARRLVEEDDKTNEENFVAFWNAFKKLEEDAEEESEVDEDDFDVDEDDEDDVDVDDWEGLVELNETDFDRACSGIMVVKAENEFDDEFVDEVSDVDEEWEDGQQIETGAERGVFQSASQVEEEEEEDAIVVGEHEVERAEDAGESSKSMDHVPSPPLSPRKRLFSETDLALPEPSTTTDDLPRDIAPLPKRPRLFKLSHVALGSAVGFVGGVVAAIAGLSALEGFIEAMEV